MTVNNFFAIRPAVALLMLLMLMTRGNHFGGVLTLPDASLATFFFAGLWFSKRYSLFAALLAEAACIDYLAISHFGVSDFCVSPAYGFLLPAYGLMWFFGEQMQENSGDFFSSTAKLFTALFLATSLAFLLTNGSFYWFSGKYPQANWVEYIQRSFKYYPPYLGFAMMYGAIIVILKAFVSYLGFAGVSRQRV